MRCLHTKHLFKATLLPKLKNLDFFLIFRTKQSFSSQDKTADKSKKILGRVVEFLIFSIAIGALLLTIKHKRKEP